MDPNSDDFYLFNRFATLTTSLLQSAVRDFLLFVFGLYNFFAPAGCYHPAEEQADDNIRPGASFVRVTGSK